MKNLLIAVLILLPMGAAAESGLRLGGAWGAGSAARYKGSFSGSLFFGWNAGESSAIGVDLLFNTQHIAKPSAGVGAAGKEHYDAKINVGALTAYGRRELALSRVLSVSGVVGAGVYQVNTWEGCRNQVTGECADHHGVVRIESDNRFGVNAGLGMLAKLGESVAVGPELRVHQILGGGRQASPAYITATLLFRSRL